MRTLTSWTENKWVKDFTKLLHFLIQMSSSDVWMSLEYLQNRRRHCHDDDPEYVQSRPSVLYSSVDDLKEIEVIRTLSDRRNSVWASVSYAIRKQFLFDRYSNTFDTIRVGRVYSQSLHRQWVIVVKTPGGER